MSMKKNAVIFFIIFALALLVAVLAYLNRGDAELRRALEDNREFEVRINGDTVENVNMQALMDVGPVEFTTTFATSVSAPRETRLEGVELRLLLEALNIDASQASSYIVSGLDSFISPLSASEVNREETVYVCFSMDGEILKKQSEGGFGPFLLAIRGERFAQRWCKHIEAVNVIIDYSS